MKKTVLVICLIFVGLLGSAQSWNPYVSQGIISPSPLLPVEFDGVGMATFNIGNTGSSPLVYNRANPDNMVLVIKLFNGVPDKKNPLAALHGSWVSGFKWTYDASTTTYTGVQKRTIRGYKQGTITVAYRVVRNTSLVETSNGFSVSIQAPSYASSSNTTQDDFVSSFTYTGAYDYGDAPASYGSAGHGIDMFKDPVTGSYTKYITLGNSVDQESEVQPSASADGDDKNGDDEDGVTFPLLTAGSTVSIPVVVTAHDGSFGILNAWFDWNGDGDFTDAGENVGAPQPVFTSGTYDLAVTIPETAITTAPTFARFRVGNMSGPTEVNAWGEVEDYQVSIQGQDIQEESTETVTLSITDKKEAAGILGSNILVYPNPAIDRYYVKISIIGSYKLELLDVTGRLLYSDSMEVESGNGGVKELSRRRLPTGQYFLRVTNKEDGQRHTVKVLMAD